MNADSSAFARLHSNPEIVPGIEASLDHSGSVAKFARYRQTIDEYGFGRWAVCLRETGELIGYTGVQPIRADLAVAPGFEIGWRLFRHARGNGYATEAARLALADVFSRCGLPEVYSFTGASNARSEAVMRRAGMQRCPDKDFFHPDELNGQCIVYRATPAKRSSHRSGLLRGVPGDRQVD